MSCLSVEEDYPTEDMYPQQVDRPLDEDLHQKD
jgi:hypothetical protein